jgi:hypothetical protein
VVLETELVEDKDVVCVCASDKDPVGVDVILGEDDGLCWGVAVVCADGD